MLSSRAVKPKLSLTISTAATSNASHSSTRPSLSLNFPSPVAMSMPLRSPISPSPISPTARNTRLNQRGFSTVQQPSFTYANSSSSKSILKKDHAESRKASTRRLQFREEPTVHAITPVENGDEYYGSYTKMAREERRWARR